MCDVYDPNSNAIAMWPHHVVNGDISSTAILLHTLLNPKLNSYPKIYLGSMQYMFQSRAGSGLGGANLIKTRLG